jgi:hypothetical protein
MFLLLRKSSPLKSLGQFYIAIDEIVLSYMISIVEYLIFYIAIEEIVLSYMISILEYLIFYSAIDEIVLSYVISILEDLGDDKNAEDNIDEMTDPK